MSRRTIVLSGLATVALLMLNLAPTVGSDLPPADKDTDSLLKKVRELEERIARLEKQAATDAAVSVGTVPVAEVIVNLAEPRLTRYLKCKVALRVDEADHKRTQDAVNKHKVEIRNAMIILLCDQTVASVSGVKNLDRLKDELNTRLGKVVFPNQKENPIKEVLFEEFIVQ